jgi:hypothetical protein
MVAAYGCCAEPPKIDRHDRPQQLAGTIGGELDHPADRRRQRFGCRHSPAERARPADERQTNLVRLFLVRHRSAVIPDVDAAHPLDAPMRGQIGHHRHAHHEHDCFDCESGDDS